jgi:hypothetical protein
MGPLLAALAVSLAAAHPQAPQPAVSAPLDFLPALRGDYFRLDSKAVGRAYHIYVRYPEDYGKDPPRLYPVVYLLDGDILFPLLAPEHLFLNYDEHLPEAIVVGIAYGSFDPTVNRRDVDFRWPDAAIPAGKAGAAAFEKFLETELLPAIERRYRAGSSSASRAPVPSSSIRPSPRRMSSGGGSPAMPPARRNAPYSTADRPAASDPISVSSSPAGPATIRAFAPRCSNWLAAWQGRRDAPWTLKAVTIDGGTHAADIPNVYRAGMLWLFRGALEPAPAPAH